MSGYSIPQPPINGSNSVTVLNADFLPAQESGTARYITIQVGNTAFVGTIAVQVSNDGVSWYNTYGENLNASPGSSANQLTAVSQYFGFLLKGRYFRIRLTAYTSGTPTIYWSIYSFDISSIAGTQVTSIQISPAANANGKFSISKLVSAATTNATSVKTTASGLHGYSFTNTTAAFKFVKFYNKNSAPTVGTDSPLFHVVIPPNANVDFDSSVGIAFATGLAYAVTNAAGDLDATAVAAGDVVGYVAYL